MKERLNRPREPKVVHLNIQSSFKLTNEKIVDKSLKFY